MTALAAPVTHTDWHLSFPRVVRAEWIKLVSLRSTWWSIATVALLTIGIALAIAAATSSGGPGDAASIVLLPTQFTMLLAAVLGAITVTGEYATGMIRSTLTSEPRRGSALLGKALAVAGFIALSTAVIFALTMVAVTLVLGSGATDWTDPLPWLAHLGAGVLTMVCFALVGAGMGFALRSGPGALSVTVAIIFILPMLPTLISSAPGWEWVGDAGQYLPTNASGVLMFGAGSGSITVVAAGVALLAWTVGSLGIGWAILRTRDA